MKCIICKQEIKWEEVTNVFEHIFEQTDSYGMESLTEYQQVVVEGLCCSEECYENLK